MTRTAAITPTPSAIPQKSGRSAIAGESHMTTSAATAPNTFAIATLRAAAPSPPAAKYIAQDTNAAGTISWKFDGRSSPLPRSPSVSQWKLKFSATQVHTNARIPTAAARGSRPFIRSAMLRLLSAVRQWTAVWSRNLRIGVSAVKMIRSKLEERGISRC